MTAPTSSDDAKSGFANGSEVPGNSRFESGVVCKTASAISIAWPRSRCAAVTPFPDGIPNNFNGLEGCSEAECEPKRNQRFSRGDLLSVRPGTWQVRSSGSGIGLLGPGRALPMSAAVSPNMMLASCEPREPRQLQVAHFRLTARRLLRQIAKPRVAPPSLARLRAACNASAPQKGVGQRANFRARLSSRALCKRACTKRACKKLASSEAFSWE